MSLDLFAVLLGGATALLPVFARDILHVGPTGLGLLRSAPAVGALATSVFLTRYPLERRIGRALFRAVMVFGVLWMILFPELRRIGTFEETERRPHGFRDLSGTGR
jgi:hypothetical protein